MKIAEIDSICFVGAGTMGCFNALMATVAGYKAVLYDVDVRVLDAVPATLQGMAGFMVHQGMYAAEDMPAAIERVTVNPDLASAVAEADLVSESVSERLEIKRQVHRSLDELCSAHTLITTNTSSLLVSDIEDVFTHGERFAALHSHLGSTLIDIVPAPRTATEVVDTLERYVNSIKGVPLVLKKENPGYVLNALIGPLLAMGLVLVIEERTTFEEVDRAWMRAQGAACGPFGLMDLFGINVIHDSWQKPNPGREDLQSKVLELLNPYIESGTLGVKSGKGFYNYPEPSYLTDAEVHQSETNALLESALLVALISSGIVIASNGVAEAAEIDRAWRVSFSVPQGPFAALDDMGVATFLSTRKKLVAEGLLPADLAQQIAAYLLPAKQATA